MLGELSRRQRGARPWARFIGNEGFAESLSPVELVVHHAPVRKTD